jgi:hypothetical protein
LKNIRVCCKTVHSNNFRRRAIRRPGALRRLIE